MTCAVLLMQATSSPLAPQVTSDWLTRVAKACSRQLAGDASPYWGSTIDGCRVGANPTDINRGEMAFAIVDEIPDPGAVAYHDVDGNAVPYAVLALSTCSTLDDASKAISHELLEANADVACNLWADDGQGNEFAREASDGVESNSYGVDLGDGQPNVAVSDFVLPAFFQEGAPPPYNFCSTRTPPSGNAPAAPFKTAQGGYQLQRDSGGNAQDVPAARAVRIDGAPRPARARRMQAWTSRAARRGWGPGASLRKTDPAPPADASTKPPAGETATPS